MDIEIDPKDIVIQTTHAGLGAGIDPAANVHVKIIHTPTGWWGEATEKNELAARDAALTDLRRRMR